MNKFEVSGTLRAVSATIAGLLVLILLTPGCTPKSTDDEHRVETSDTISLESALALAESDERARIKDSLSDSDNIIDEAITYYKANNALVEDPSYDCNSGREALSAFVSSYLQDRNFRLERTHLSDPNTFDIDRLKPYTLRIIVPDSTGFFASWNYVSRDSAVFMSGWINSEVLEELTLVRVSPDHVWQLVDYFSAM